MSPRPRIAIDATAISPVGKGIARVQRETVRALAQLRRYDLVAYAGANVELGLPTTRLRLRPALLREQIALARAARRTDVVLTWTDRLPVAGHGRFVVWLFETPTRRIAQNRAAGAGVYQRASDLVTQALWRHSLRRAAAVLAGSESTAADIAEHVPTLRRLQVLYPGVGHEFRPGPGRDGRYVFHIASADPRDNTAAVLETVRHANAQLGRPIGLVVAGTAPAGSRPDGVEFVGRVSDAELVELYRGAAAYLDASLHEGFGYQPLEAMACGTPVIASDAPSVREVVGDAGLLCDPNDVEARAALLGRVLEEPELAEQLRRRGLERARAFTWERTAETLAAVLDEVVR